MTLTLYKKKRDFKSTKEPAGKAVREGAKKLTFVIQRHKASHLHYDFRLEMDGVLKSWAIPKGPSMNPGDKRLAIQVEDHPLEYGTFEGTIPEGNYGAGIVEIWDSGVYSDTIMSGQRVDEKQMLEGLKEGNLKFRLYGKKLKGEFTLVKMKGRNDNSWLLMKHKDEFAINEKYDSETKTLKNSPINKWLKKNASEQLRPTAIKTKKKAKVVSIEKKK